MTSKFYTNEKADFHGLSFITVKSNALKKRADVTVYEPKTSIDANKLPIVILLHGVYGSHWSWTAKGKVHETLQRLIDEGKCQPMLLVMPSDGLYGDGSGYVPHQKENYEKWIVEDVIDAVKEQFPVINNDSPIFISGLSMGGFGAMRLAAKYSGLFRAFSGHSSITHFEQLRKFTADFEPLKSDAKEQDGVLKWMIKNKSTLPPFRFDCGTDDVLVDENRELHKELRINQVNHTYLEYDGGHSWEYWQTHIEKSLIFFNQFVK